MQAGPTVADKFRAAIQRYTDGRAAASDTWTMMADRAWLDYQRAMRAAQAEWDRQIAAATVTYDDAVASLGI